ncbi:MAG TPA: L,D-transpeptidase family protein [Desulfomonilaceae bacterium]|nr:L,D-transpeptidase family protein [Desulfomonilaceae bacterium]
MKELIRTIAEFLDIKQQLRYVRHYFLTDYNKLAKLSLHPRFREMFLRWKKIGLLLCLAGAMLQLPIQVWPMPFWPVEGASLGQSRPRIVIFKGTQALELHENNGKIRTYKVCLGLNPIGPKRITGDQKTPEGDYYICSKSTASRFHRFLGISYPGAADAQAAFEQGLISLDDRDSIISSSQSGRTPPWDTKLGGWVGIHGYPTDWYRRLWVILFFPKPHNWTDGCIAMWNFEVEELFDRVNIGTPVKILP